MLALASADWSGDDGQWKGEGIAESQDWGQWGGAHGGWAAPAVAWAGHGAWAHGAAPLGPDGRVVDTPEVAHAKAAHLAAKAAAGGHGAWGPAAEWGHGAWAHGAAPLGHDGRVVDTPEVAHAKAAHFAAKAAAGGHGAW